MVLKQSGSVGAQVPSIPKEAESVEVNETNNYYYGGAL
jgi:hypothetical protein